MIPSPSPAGSGSPPTARVAEALRRVGIDPGPAMPAPDPDEVAAADRAAAGALVCFPDVSEALAAADGDFVAARDALEAATDTDEGDRTVFDRLRSLLGRRPCLNPLTSGPRPPDTHPRF